MNEISTINNPISLSKPISDVIDDFILTKNSNHTQRAYKSDLEDFFNGMGLIMIEELGQLPFYQLITNIQAYIETIKKTERQEDRKRVLNAKTVNRKLNSLRAFFKYLVTTYNYPKNPLDSFKNLKVNNFSNTESLTKGEVTNLLERAKGEHRKSESKFRNYLIIVFLFALALRREEVANLKWADLDLSKKTVNVYQKGGNYKLLPLPHPVCTLLIEFRELYKTPVSYVFHPIRNNSHKTLLKPLSTSYIFYLIKTIGGELIPDKKITPHSLRKTFIELALNNGDDFISICNATGHSTVEMIKYYDTRDSLKNNSVHSMSKLI